MTRAFTPDPEPPAETPALMQEPSCQTAAETSPQHGIETIVAAIQADASSQAYTFLP